MASGRAAPWRLEKDLSLHSLRSSFPARVLNAVVSLSLLGFVDEVFAFFQCVFDTLGWEFKVSSLEEKFPPSMSRVVV